MDIGIVVDVSGSLSKSAFLVQQAFLRGLGETLNIDPEGTHAGLVVFSERAITHLGLQVSNIAVRRTGEINTPVRTPI